MKYVFVLTVAVALFSHAYSSPAKDPSVFSEKELDDCSNPCEIPAVGGKGNLTFVAESSSVTSINCSDVKNISVTSVTYEEPERLAILYELTNNSMNGSIHCKIADLTETLSERNFTAVYQNETKDPSVFSEKELDDCSDPCEIPAVGGKGNLTFVAESSSVTSINCSDVKNISVTSVTYEEPGRLAILYELTNNSMNGSIHCKIADLTGTLSERNFTAVYQNETKDPSVFSEKELDDCSDPCEIPAVGGKGNLTFVAESSSVTSINCSDVKNISVTSVTYEEPGRLAILYELTNNSMNGSIHCKIADLTETLSERNFTAVYQNEKPSEFSDQQCAERSDHCHKPAVEAKDPSVFFEKECDDCSDPCEIPAVGGKGNLTFVAESSSVTSINCSDVKNISVTSVTYKGPGRLAILYELTNNSTNGSIHCKIADLTETLSERKFTAVYQNETIGSRQKKQSTLTL
ncbi:uncharacterized protein [Apostichopus japonicus]